MTPDELAAIRARAHSRESVPPWMRDWPRKVAESAADVPMLVAEVDRLTAEVAEAHAALNRVRDFADSIMERYPIKATGSNPGLVAAAVLRILNGEES